MPERKRARETVRDNLNATMLTIQEHIKDVQSLSEDNIAMVKDMKEVNI